MKNHNVVLACLIILLSGLPLAAQSAAVPGDIKVFAVNMTNQPVDLQLGANPAMLQLTGLAGYSATRLTRVAKPGSYQVWYRFAAGKVQLSPRNAGGQPLLYTLNAGKTYLLRVAAETVVDMVEMPEPLKASPLLPDQQVAKICFFNATATALPSLQVASAPNANVLVSVKDLPSKELCNFGTINYPAEYGCFWPTPNQAKETVTGYLDPSGKPIMTKFAENTYWALVVWPEPKTGNPTGSLFNITPQ